MSADADTADGEPDLRQRVAELERRLGRLDRENAYLKRALFALAGDGVDTVDGLPDVLDGLGEAIRSHQHRLDDIEQDLDTSGLEYQQLTKAQRVARIRDHLIGKAGNRGNGKAAMTPDEIGALFDGHPSTGYTYKLADAAAEADGFDVSAPRDGNKRVTVDLAAVKTSPGDSPA